MRKILKVCRGVLEYLSVAEIVESMEELVTFVKNLTPGITEMAKKVEGRIEELTHQVHADMLKKSLNAVKAMSTQLITAIKTYVLTVQRGNKKISVFILLPGNRFVINVGRGMAKWLRALDLKSGGPWLKSSTYVIRLFGFILSSPEFNSLTMLVKRQLISLPAVDWNS